jgi:hypothetical protein
MSTFTSKASKRNATARGDLDAIFSLSRISFVFISPCGSVSFLHFDTFGIHDLYDHLLQGTTVPLHHILGFESHDIRLLHAARARASLVHSTITSFIFPRLGGVRKLFGVGHAVT